MEEQTWLESLFGHLIYVGILLAIILIVQRVADVAINKYFKAIYNRAEEKGESPDDKRYRTLAAATRKIVSFVLWSLAILAALVNFGVDVAFLLSGAGAAGIFLGIAGKDILMDYYTGAMVLIENQYRVGDVIKIDNDHSGVVEDIELRTVILRDIDGFIHVVPHSHATTIINMTFDFARVNVEVGVAYDSDLDKVKKVVNEVGEDMAKDQELKDRIINPIAFDRYMSFDDSQITVRALGDVVAGQQWALSSEFNLRLKKAFDKNGIEIPFPQRVMHTAAEKHPKK